MPLVLIIAALFAPLIVFEAGNLTGFSWQRLSFLSEDELIDAAIRSSYVGIYDNAEDLKADYSTFSPKVRYWGSWIWDDPNDLTSKLLGYTRYQVLLPDSVIVLDTNGKLRYGRSLPTVVAPDHPELGIVGTVQQAKPPFDIVTHYKVTWSGDAAASVFTSGHCFSAYTESATGRVLTISTETTYPLEIGVHYGFYLVAAQLSPVDPSSGMRGLYAWMRPEERVSEVEILQQGSPRRMAQRRWIFMEAIGLAARRRKRGPPLSSS